MDVLEPVIKWENSDKVHKEPPILSKLETLVKAMRDRYEEGKSHWVNSAGPDYNFKFDPVFRNKANEIKVILKREYPVTIEETGYLGENPVCGIEAEPGKPIPYNPKVSSSQGYPITKEVKYNGTGWLKR